MDTYTKQVDCPEIQGERPRILMGDRFIVRGTSDELCGGPAYPSARKNYIWLPRQSDWQNILFREHYAPALPKSAKVIQAALIHMHREFVDYMEAWKIEQPCEAWARIFMNFHNKRWTEEGWV